MRTNELPVFLTEAEVRSLLRVSKGTIRRYRLSGKLPFKKFDGAIRYTNEDVLLFLDRTQNNLLTIN